MLLSGRGNGPLSQIISLISFLRNWHSFTLKFMPARPYYPASQHLVHKTAACTQRVLSVCREDVVDVSYQQRRLTHARLSDQHEL